MSENENVTEYSDGVAALPFAIVCLGGIVKFISDGDTDWSIFVGALVMMVFCTLFKWVRLCALLLEVVFFGWLAVSMWSGILFCGHDVTANTTIGRFLGVLVSIYSIVALISLLSTIIEFFGKDCDR